MKKLGLLFFIIPAICQGQVVFDFGKNGLSGWQQCMKNSWDTATSPITGVVSLAHTFDNSVSGHDQISVRIDSLRPDLGITTWELTVHHGYNPSSSNNWAMFLASDRGSCEMHPGGTATGYAVGVNYHGSDDQLKLWEVKKGRGSVMIETNLNWQESIGIDSSCRLRIIRDPNGEWIIHYRLQNNRDDWAEAGRGSETKTIIPVFAGLYYEYSSKQDRKLWLEEFSVNGYFLQDTIAPDVEFIRITGSNKLLVRFTEAIDIERSADPLNFLADYNLGHPAEILPRNGRELLLTFNQSFPNKLECTLLVSNVSDPRGNILYADRFYFTYCQPEEYDIIINEFMADPTPSMGLPEYEYIELYNRSNKSISIADWKLECNHTHVVFPDRVIDSGAYFVITHVDALNLFPDTIVVFPLLRNKTALKNDEGVMTLYDPQSRTIDWLYYNENWHKNDYFASGGWSLERIGSARFCGGGLNWTTSESPAGGTPGGINSVAGCNPDTLSPGILRIELPGNDVIKIIFSEPMDSTGQSDTSNYSIIGFPVRINEIELLPPGYEEVLLKLNEEPGSDSVFYLEISGLISDCNGNSLKNRSVKIAWPDTPGHGGIIINEILFNPVPGGIDFVELYNPSTTTCDLADLMIANRNIYTDSITSVTRMCDGHMLFFPKDYLLLSEDLNQLMINYPAMPPGNWLELSHMPAFGDKEGTVVLMNRWYQVIDEFHYSSSMHFPLLASDEGVSLERISPFSPTNDPGNWHSAAEDAGFATPGYQNSQGMIEPSGISGIIIEPEIFSPDNDGKDDYLTIRYHNDLPGSIISAWIFDPLGRQVCQLASNRLTGACGRIKWDGTDHMGRRVNTGIYLVYIKVYTISGQVKQIKKTCVLSGRNR